MKDEAMTSAVDGLKQRFMDMSQPDDDGVYRNGATKRKARTELAMQCLTELWNAACKDVSFPVPDSGIGFAAVGSLARGQLGPSSDLDLVIIYEPRTLSDQQLNELANKLWYPLWDSGLDLDHSIRTRAQCEEVTDHDLPAAMGWLDVQTHRRRHRSDHHHRHVHPRTLAQGRPQAPARTARLRQSPTRRIRPASIRQSARHQGGPWGFARFGARLRARRLMAGRPPARHLRRSCGTSARRTRLHPSGGRQGYQPDADALSGQSGCHAWPCRSDLARKRACRLLDRRFADTACPYRSAHLLLA